MLTREREPGRGCMASSWLALLIASVLLARGAIAVESLHVHNGSLANCETTNALGTTVTDYILPGDGFYEYVGDVDYGDCWYRNDPLDMTLTITQIINWDDGILTCNPMQVFVHWSDAPFVSDSVDNLPISTNCGANDCFSDYSIRSDFHLEHSSDGYDEDTATGHAYLYAGCNIGGLL